MEQSLRPRLWLRLRLRPARPTPLPPELLALVFRYSVWWVLLGVLCDTFMCKPSVGRWRAGGRARTTSSVFVRVCVRVCKG
jgi:hypothetical protein